MKERGPGGGIEAGGRVGWGRGGVWGEGVEIGGVFWGKEVVARVEGVASGSGGVETGSDASHHERKGEGGGRMEEEVWKRKKKNTVLW